ncbi:MAG TPA: class I SAM-dependent methyltransferase [Desulfitobacteriaceae bacterium]|nr:class I SAM-dependent methyltransferase [Desulfitobacteriaceae bacterium]
MKNRASGTAEGTNYMRYYESLRPPEKRICNDYLAYHFMAWWVKAAALICRPFPPVFMDWAFEKKGSGVSGFLAVRTRLFDDYVLKRVGEGVRQYVILGAGLDSRAYRFADQLAGVKTFEIDHPFSQTVKKERVTRYFGKLPAHVDYVPLDFTHDDMLTCLKNAGYDPGLPTVFTLEGVVMYLDEGSVRKTLTFIREYCGSGSSVMFDYVYAAALNGRLKSRIISHMNSLQYIFNEPILFGIEQGEAESFLRTLGFIRAEDFSPRRLYELYLKPLVPERTISDVYAIAAGYI